MNAQDCTGSIAVCEAREKPIAGALKRAVATLRVWRRRMVERHQLAMLDDRMLRDIGITRYDASAEAAKPFWVP